MLDDLVTAVQLPPARTLDAWDKLRALAEAAKFKSVALLTFVGWAGGVHAAAGRLGDYRLWLGTLAVALGSMGTNGVTGFIDRRMDAVMERTRSRPVPQGRLTPLESLGFGLILCLLSLLVAALTGHPWSIFWLLFGILDTAVIYNGWSKPRTPWNVILGSPAGGATVMVAASAVTGRPYDLVSLLLAALIVAWTPVHIWSLAILHVDDYRCAGVPMLPVVHGVETTARCAAASSLFLCGLGLALPLIAGFSPAGLFLSLVLPLPVVIYSFFVGSRPTPNRAYILFKLSSPYLAGVFLLVIWQAVIR